MARLRTRFFIIFWLIPGPDTGNQEGIPRVALILSAHGAEIRIVTYGPTAAQGNGARELGPWPNKSATALRENAPQGPFLAPQGSRKAGESFN